MQASRGFCHNNGAITAALCVGLAGFAVYSLASAQTFFAPQADPVEMQAAHDSLRNGFRILESSRRDLPRASRLDQNDPTVILLDDWSYTDKTPPSPYQ